MMKPVNLIPAPRRQAGQRRLAIRRWSAIVVTYACILLGGYGMVRVFWFSQNADRRQVNDRLQAVLDTNEQTQNALVELRAQLTEAQRTLDANLAVVEKPDWSLLLLLLARTLEDEVVLRQCQLVPGVADGQAARSFSGDSVQLASDRGGSRLSGYTLLLTGLGRRQSDVSGFVMRLEDSGLFDRVKLVQTSREPFLRQDAVAFRLECTLSEGGGTP